MRTLARAVDPLDDDQLARNVVDEVRPITGVDAAAMYVSDEGTATIKRLAVSALLPGRAPSFRTQIPETEVGQRTLYAPQVRS